MSVKGKTRLLKKDPNDKKTLRRRALDPETGDVYYPKRPTPFSLQDIATQHHTQHDYLNKDLIQLFFNRDSLKEKFHSIRRQLRRIELHIARTASPYCLGQKINFLNMRSRTRTPYMVSKILFSPFPPYYILFGVPLDKKVTFHIELHAGRISILRRPPSAIALEELIRSRKVIVDPECPVDDEEAVPSMVKAILEGEKLYRENPETSVNFVNNIVQSHTPIKF